MNWLKGVIAKVAAWFSSGKAKAALNTAADYVVRAMPYIDIASQIVAGLTPTIVDDAVLAVIRKRFPRLFDGSIATADELKLYALAVATEALKAKYPELTTSIARSAVQLAYTAQAAEKQ